MRKPIINQQTIRVFNTIPSLKFPHNFAKELITEVVNHFHFIIKDISIIFLNNKEIQKINNLFLSHNFATDVISFRLNNGKMVEGEIYIGVQTAKSNAKLYRNGFYEELKRLTIHGSLHLIGFDDKLKKDREEMSRWENYFLDVKK